MALGLGLTLSLTAAEELCSLAPDTYSEAKATYPGLAFALETLEGYSSATWFEDRMPESERASTLTSLLSECSEDTRLSIVVYGLPDKDCDAGFSTSGTVQSTSDYESFLAQLTDAVGDRKVLYVVEPDAVGLLAQDGGCGADAGYLDNLKVAIEALSVNENAELYLDVGYWLLAYDSTLSSVATVVTELASAGRVKGITINTSNYRSTDECAGYCTSFQSAMGSEDMTCIIDTSRNYNGSPSSEWCNVKEAGVGKPPTSETGVSNIDYFMWIKPPGESDGECTDGSHTSDALQGTSAGTFFEEGFQLLWDQGYFVAEKGMATIAEGNSSSGSQTQDGSQTQGGSQTQDYSQDEEPAATPATTTASPTTEAPVATTAAPATTTATPTATTATPATTTSAPGTVAPADTPATTSATQLTQGGSSCKTKRRMRTL